MDNVVNEAVIKEENISESIKATIEEIKKINSKIKTTKFTLRSHLLANPEYSSAVDGAKEANKSVKNARAGVMKNNNDAYKVNSDLKELRSELKLNKDTLSQYLLTYEKQSGLDHIETPDGTLIEIKKTASIQLSLI